MNQFRLVILVLVCAGLIGACSPRQFTTITIYDQPDAYVRLEFDRTVKKGTEHSHPVSLRPEQIAAVLAGVRIEEPVALVRGDILQRESVPPIHPTFSDKDIAFFAPLLALALSKATPEGGPMPGSAPRQIRIGRTMLNLRSKMRRNRAVQHRRGTRPHHFLDQTSDQDLIDRVQQPDKTAFKLFDFFASCEYFEKEFKYDEVLKLPKPPSGKSAGPAPPPPPPPPGGSYDHQGDDMLASMRVEMITAAGMKIDRMFFDKFEDTVRENETIAKAVEAGQWDQVIDYINREVFDKPDEFYSLDKLRKAAAVDRRLTLREILEKVFGLIPRFKSKDELLEEEFAKFVADIKPEDAIAIPAIKTFFKAYVISGRVRDIIDSRQFTDLATYPMFSTRDFRAVPAKYRALVPEYVKDYVSLNHFSP